MTDAREVIAKLMLGGAPAYDQFNVDRANEDADAIITALTASGYVIATKEEASVPTEARTYFMFENFTFKHIDAPTLDLIVDEALKLSEQDRYGSLCPIGVMSGKKELRRVGEMVHFCPSRDDVRDQIRKWTDAALSDPDIPRLVASRPAAPKPGV